VTKRAVRDAGVLLVFILLTIVMTWPWAAHMRDTSFDSGDSYLCSWVLAWDFHQFFHDPLHLFDANIFFPYRHSLALSEHQFGIAMLFFPLRAAGVPPLSVHGFAMLFGFAFSGFGAFRLARTLTGSTAAAWVSGIAFAFVPYRFHHLPHLVYVFAGWMPLLAEAVVLFARRTTWPRAAWLGLAFFMSGITSIHWFLLGSVPTLAMAVGFVARAQPPARRAWLRAALTVGAACLFLLPFFLPYLKIQELYGFGRSVSEVDFYGARLVDWVTPDWNMKLWRGMGERPPRGEFCLFPGFLLIALALVGVFAAVRARARGWATGALFAATGFVGSFGMSTPFHRLLYLLPPFHAIRGPIRWAMVADLGLALLAGVATAALVEAWSRGRSGFVGLAIASLLAVSLLFEDRFAPLYLHRGEPDPDNLTIFLSTTPMRGGLWELPDDFGESNALHDLRAADHWKPLVNGYSGFQTPIAEDLHSLLVEGRSRRILDALEAVPVSYVTMRPRRMTPDQRASAVALVSEGLESRRLRFVHRFPPDDSLYVVVRTEPDAPPLEREKWPATGAEISELTGSIDTPPENAIVAGALTVRGWARTPDHDLEVEILIDEIARVPRRESRIPRRDVEKVLPWLGDCSAAGYESTFAFLPGDEGEHKLSVIFHGPDGRARHYPVRKFTWKSGP
jgi:hypothetical protein